MNNFWENLKKKIYLKIGNLFLRICYFWKNDKRKIFKSSILAFLGFLLSPLSWWNDLFVNLPLAYFFAWIFSKILDLFFEVPKILFVSFFVIGYFLTNLLGFLMIHYSIVSLSNEKKFSIKNQILVSLIYTSIIIFLSYLNIFDLSAKIDIIPQFIK